MPKKILVNFFAVFISLGLSSDILADHQFKQELDAGKAVVLIINAAENSKSELYADWSYNLNQFSSEVGDAYVFHKISKNKLNKLIYDSTKYSNSYSMFFMKKGHPSYFYDGPIVESQVYKFMNLTYQGKPIKPDYLTQFSPDEVVVKFKECK